jgi:hypothetical protein
MGVGLRVQSTAVSRPVRALEQVTRQVADGTPPAPLSTTTGSPELRRPAVTFSAMSGAACPASTADAEASQCRTRRPALRRKAIADDRWLPFPDERARIGR